MEGGGLINPKDAVQEEAPALWVPLTVPKSKSAANPAMANTA